MVTFSDLIMLLLTFFVMLLTMSSMDTKRLEDILMTLQDAPGLLEFAGSRAVPDLGHIINTYTDTGNKFVIDQKLLRDLFIPLIQVDKMKEMVKDINELISLSDDERGIVLSFQEELLFDSGKATIKGKSLPVLASVAKAIESCANDILIMGHTDNIPIRGGSYPSNWELSAYRGLSVLEYFVKDKGLRPMRFSVGGYGPSRPRRPNNTPENRALNRRVEIIFRHL
jgi:chemotaxis protein MotB